MTIFRSRDHFEFKEESDLANLPFYKGIMLVGQCEKSDHHFGKCRKSKIGAQKGSLQHVVINPTVRVVINTLYSHNASHYH